VLLYKELSEVERFFANLKDVIDMQPIYYRTADRVEAHIFVAALPFPIHRAIEKKLKAARLDLSASEALTILRSIRVVDIDLGNGQRQTFRHRRYPARGSRAARPWHHQPRPTTPPQPGVTDGLGARPDYPGW
jgi:hypothetical protein